MADIGRPRIEIDWDQFDKLCAMQCTLIEIAEWFGCSVDTIERRCWDDHDSTFADLYKKKSAKGKISIRRKQLDVALSGNTTMLIWLGKQYLGQRERLEENEKPPVGDTAPQKLTTDQVIEIVRAAREK